jgi:hypothetical protein
MKYNNTFFTSKIPAICCLLQTLTILAFCADFFAAGVVFLSISVFAMMFYTYNVSSLKDYLKGFILANLPAPTLTFVGLLFVFSLTKNFKLPYLNTSITSAITLMIAFMAISIGPIAATATVRLVRSKIQEKK